MTNPTDRNAVEIRTAFTNLVTRSLSLPDKLEEFEQLRSEATRRAASAFISEATAAYLTLLTEMDNWYSAQRTRLPD
jgi:predicted DNA-binding protein